MNFFYKNKYKIKKLVPHQVTIPNQESTSTEPRQLKLCFVKQRRRKTRWKFLVQITGMKNTKLFNRCVLESNKCYLCSVYKHKIVSQFRWFNSGRVHPWNSYHMHALQRVFGYQ